MAFAQQLDDRYGRDRIRIIAEDEVGRLDLDRIPACPGTHAGVLVRPAACSAPSKNAAWAGPVPCTPNALASTLGAAARTHLRSGLARTWTTVTVPNHKTILEAVEEVGVPVLSSAGGSCSTCETQIIGQPKDRDVVRIGSKRESRRGRPLGLLIFRAAAGRPRLVLDRSATPPIHPEVLPHQECFRWPSTTMKPRTSARIFLPGDLPGPVTRSWGVTGDAWRRLLPGEHRQLCRGG